MPYDLQFIRPEHEMTGTARAVTMNLLSNLPTNYKIFAQYYPRSANLDEGIETALRNFGARTGENVLVNIGRIDDEKYDFVTKMFNMDRRLPRS